MKGEDKQLLQRVKEQYAEDNGYNNWEDCEYDEDLAFAMWFVDEISQRYAKEKLQEANNKINRIEEANEPYGNFFDRVISDGEDPQKAAQDLGLI